jgi:ABC-type transport system involved in multi-copper enzyme maturation permease subunit
MEACGSLELITMPLVHQPSTLNHQLDPMLSSAPRSDFADWLSPMLVKELRQGMRSRIFAAAFYLTQVLMILSTLFSLLAASAPDGAPANIFGFLNWLFWFMISVPLLFVMPLLGFGALHGEMKARTLELVFLTRLSAWRIVFGKWAALMAETLLLVCSVLPYVILRYFLGGVDILEDLQGLVFLLVASALLTATTLAISPYESKLLRALFVLGLIFAFQSLLGLLFAWAAFSGSGISSSSSIRVWQVYLVLLAFVPAIIVLALEIAASRIAPPAENHAVRKRLIGVYLLIIVPVLAYIIPTANALHGLSLLFLAVVIVDALAEPIESFRVIRHWFMDLGAAGRALSLFFSPGWGSASWYVLLVAGLGAVMLYSQSRLDDATEVLVYVSYLGTLIFPAALIRLFRHSTPYFLAFYIGLQGLFAAVTFGFAMMSGFSNESLTRWLSPIPSCVFLLSASDQITAAQALEFLRFTGLVTGGSLGILLLRAASPLPQGAKRKNSSASP